MATYVSGATGPPSPPPAKVMVECSDPLDAEPPPRGSCGLWVGPVGCGLVVVVLDGQPLDAQPPLCSEQD